MPTGISYLDEVWNPVTGCSHISAGCKNCWAETMAKRLKGMHQKKYDRPDPFKPFYHASEIDRPKSWKKPKTVGVCFMGDLFHDDVGYRNQFAIFVSMRMYHLHRYLVLTKRPENLAKYLYRRQASYDYQIPDNVWIGATVENQQMANRRISQLCQVPAKNRWLSIEPMLTPIDLTAAKSDWWESNGIDWVVVGCESGSNRRPCPTEWIRGIVKQCGWSGVPVYVKQLSINGKVSTKPTEWPADLRIQQLPTQRV